MDSILHVSILDELPEFDPMDEGDVDPAYELEQALSVQARLRELQDDLTAQRQISSSTASTLKLVGSSLESIQSHFRSYPVTTYTRAPSTINLVVTQEGLAQGLKEAVVKVAKAVWKFIVSVFTTIKNYYTSNRRKAQQAQHAAKNVAVLAEANNRSAELLAGSAMDQLQKDALFTEVEALREQIERNFGGKWNALMQDLVEKGVASDNLHLFKVLGSVIHYDAEAFMKSIGLFIAQAEEGLKQQAEPDVLALKLAAVNVDTLRVNEEIEDYVDELLRNTSVRKAPNVNEYQATYATVMGSVKSQQSHRLPMGADLTTLIKAAELVHSMLGEGYLADYNNIATSMLKVTVNLDNASRVTEQLIRAGVDVSPVLLDYRSLASGIQAMETTMQVIFSQVMALTNIVSQFEQRRLAIYNRYIGAPGTSPALKAQLLAVRNELRRNLR